MNALDDGGARLLPIGLAESLTFLRITRKLLRRVLRINHSSPPPSLPLPARRITILRTLDVAASSSRCSEDLLLRARRELASIDDSSSIDRREERCAIREIIGLFDSNVGGGGGGRGLWRIIPRVIRADRITYTADTQLCDSTVCMYGVYPPWILAAPRRAPSARVSQRMAILD